MLTSDCPGSIELKRMLREMADRVGAQFAMLVDPDGELKGCGGAEDRYTAETLAHVAGHALEFQHLQVGSNDVMAFVDVCGPNETVRLYGRRITSDYVVVTVFDYDDTSGAPVIAARVPVLPSLDAYVAHLNE
jgi:hypothetical protein